MAHIITFPGSQEEPRETYASGMTCSDCGLTVDEDDHDKLYEHTVHIVRGQKLRLPRFYNLCRFNKCSPICEYCGEYMDNESNAESERGPIVSARQWEADGVLMHGHAECIADHLLQVWGGDWAFYSADKSRDAVEGAVIAGFVRERGVAA